MALSWSQNPSLAGSLLLQLFGLFFGGVWNISTAPLCLCQASRASGCHHALPGQLQMHLSLFSCPLTVIPMATATLWEFQFQKAALVAGTHRSLRLKRRSSITARWLLRCVRPRTCHNGVKPCLSSLAHRCFVKSRMWKLSHIGKCSSHIYCLWHKHHFGLQSQISTYCFFTKLQKFLFRDLKVKILGIHALSTIHWRQCVLDLFLCPSRDKQGRVYLWVCPCRTFPQIPHPALSRRMASS